MANASLDSTTSGRLGLRAGSHGVSQPALRRRTSCQAGKSEETSGRSLIRRPVSTFIVRR